MTTATTTPKHWPTVPEWHAALARATALGVRLIYHDAGTIDILPLVRGQVSAQSADWTALLAWLDARERGTR